MPTTFRETARQHGVQPPEYPWLSGRELLVREISGRVEVVRTLVERHRTALGLKAGLVVFLERRLIHLREALAALRQLPNPPSEVRRQTVDRMVSAVVGTLRHAEVDLEEDLSSQRDGGRSDIL